MTLIPLFTGRSNFNATGGTIYTQGGYTYHKFTSSGTLTVLSGTKTFEFLVVAGGARGGASADGFTGSSEYTSSGGGGGGGVTTTTYPSTNLTITVGVGGSKGGFQNGQDSQVVTTVSSTLVAQAIGGGIGASGLANAAVGGSGGGGSVKFSGTATRFLAANGTASQGNAGAASATDKGGGGGGSAAAASGITGGAGLTTYTTWWDASAPAQIAKGGDGDTGGVDAAANTGNGGGGCRSANNVLTVPGDGGSGIVIIRYAV